MDRVGFTLCLLLLCGTGTSLARSASESEIYRTQNYPCPLDEEITPCICTFDETSYDISMDCSGVKTDEELTNAFKATFPFPSVSSLTIDQTDSKYDDCNLETLSQETFGVVSFEHVDITGTTLKTVELGPFHNSHETLISLHLSSNQLSSFTFEVIGEFTKLTSLFLNGNQFDGEFIQPINSETLKTLNLANNLKINIGGDFVKACPQLQTLLLQNTGLTSLPLLPESPISMIDGLNEIVHVDLSRNDITILESNSFTQNINEPDQGTLANINLSQNNISIVFPNFITGLADGAVLDLSSNSIELLDEVVWLDIFQDVGAGAINMADNPLTCGCDVKWLIVDNDNLVSVLDEETKCLSGDSLITLPAAVFEDQCP